MFILLFAFSFLVTFLLFPRVILRLKQAGIVGVNMNSQEKEEVAEMGGLVTLLGLSAGLILCIALKSFFNYFLQVNLYLLFAALATILIVVIIGIMDDLISISQGVKAFLPVLAAFPLMALKAGDSTMNLFYFGFIDFGIFYPLIIIPLGVTGASNAINMLAGFNGLETGMGIIALSTLTVIAFRVQEATSIILLLATLGAMLATLYFNWYPAKVLIGDVGTMGIGAIMAAATIIGNFEMAGCILVIPHVFDLLFKATHGFPKSFGEYRDGKLYCPDNSPVGLAQWVMKISGGITEKNLVIVLMGIEALFALITLFLYIYKF